VYEIAVENPQRRCRGVVAVELDGVAVDPRKVPLLDDGSVHRVRAVLGDPTPRPRVEAAARSRV
jgi:cyclic beta-1,2-glucan synthetase